MQRSFSPPPPPPPKKILTRTLPILPFVEERQTELEGLKTELAKTTSIRQELEEITSEYEQEAQVAKAQLSDTQAERLGKEKV